MYQVIKFVQTLTIRWHWSQFNKTCCAHNDNWFKSSFLISWYTQKKLIYVSRIAWVHLIFFLLDNINLPKIYSNHLLPIRYLTSQKEKKIIRANKRYVSDIIKSFLLHVKFIWYSNKTVYFYEKKNLPM